MPTKPALSPARPKRSGESFLRVLLILSLGVAVLYAAKPVIIPIALAVLLSFILNPLVLIVERGRIGRVPAVMIVVVCTLVVFGAVGWGVGTQLMKLAEDLPAHKDQISAKISRLRGSGGGTVSRLMDTVRQVSDDAAGATSKPSARVAATAQPVVDRPNESALQHLLGVAGTVLEPVASAGLVFILVIFLLIRREDLRNRLIGLLGHGRLTGTTRVLVGAGERVSRLLLMQLCVNGGFALIFALSLMLLGVPYWFLWGFLTLLLRFIPYVGTWMAASLPILLSVAISPGWKQPLEVLAVFAVLDLVTANVIEPVLFGHSTGVSPVALLVAAVFWTWVWGPIGLVLSTPLTVCLVVIGQHAKNMTFLSLLLGDQPALAPSVSFYQRLLAGDLREAGALAREHSAKVGRGLVPDDMLVPALILARRDRERSGLTAADETYILDSTETILGELTATPTVPPSVQSGERELGGRESGVAASPPPFVLGCPAHHKAEELAARSVAMVLDPSEARVEVVSTRTLPARIEERIEEERPALLMVIALPPGGITQTRYLCRRLRRRFPELPIVVGYFGKVRDFDKLLVRLRAAGASYVTTSVAQTRTQLLALLAAPVATAAPVVATAPAVATVPVPVTPAVVVGA